MWYSIDWVVTLYPQELSCRSVLPIIIPFYTRSTYRSFTETMAAIWDIHDDNEYPDWDTAGYRVLFKPGAISKNDINDDIIDDYDKEGHCSQQKLISYYEIKNKNQINVCEDSVSSDHKTNNLKLHNEDYVLLDSIVFRNQISWVVGTLYQQTTYMHYQGIKLRNKL